jgi:prepilin-type N-terminal cleavage/methylation domain-containing protein/prepilin-type processing-associated H-X9-DG protein
VRKNHGFTFLELLVVIAIIGILVALIMPAVQSAREAARRTQCRSNLKQIGLGLHSYHDDHLQFPPVVIWNGGPGEPLGGGTISLGPIDRVATNNGTDRVLANWAILLLPFLEQGNLYKKFNLEKPIDDTANAVARATPLAVMLCPSDPYNNKPYERGAFSGAATGHTYARGNYGINFGVDRQCYDTQAGCSDGFHVADADLLNKNMVVWGSGVSGLNKSYRLRDFPGGTTRVAAIDELRAGIDPVDPRGVWALGMAGASATLCDGIYNLGDTSPPNSHSPQSDDIVGCSLLLAKYGLAKLTDMGMPCQVENTNGIELNAQATARSLHPGGVHVLMLDGSAHFVNENVNPQTWHNMHSKDATSSFELQFDE